MENSANLILVNARALTLDPTNPRADSVAIVGERIAAVGGAERVSRFKGAKTEVIDCKGLPLIPGLHDAHTHVLATAASMASLDCGCARLDSVSKLLAAIQVRSTSLPPGQWVRGYGLEPSALRERRYPTRQELDSAISQHPVRLEHSSRHAALLNSRGLEEVGISAETPDPPDGVIERDEKGEPTGLLLEMAGYLRERLGITRSTAEMEVGVSHLSKTLLSYGITSVQDAGPENGPQQWETFRSLTARQLIGPRVTMMASVKRLDEMTRYGLVWGSGDDRLRIGHAKIMLTCSTGQLMPAPEDLSELALRARDLGFPIAVHAIEQESVGEAIRIVTVADPSRERPGSRASHPPHRARVRNRVEHCAECPPHLMEKLSRSRAMVVTQPGFIYWRGDGYLRHVRPDLRPHLYAIGKMMDLSTPVAFGSDSPVVDPNPWPGIYSAVTGMTREGARFPSMQGKGPSSSGNKGGLDLTRALSAYTLSGAESEGTQGRKGMIREGMLADLALLDRPLGDSSKAEILETKSRLTIVGGDVVWSWGEI